MACARAPQILVPTTVKRSAVVAPEVNLRIMLRTGNIPMWTSPEVENRGVRGSTKKTDVLYFFKKVTNLGIDDLLKRYQEASIFKILVIGMYFICTICIIYEI